MPFTIFFAWQMDRPTNVNRWFIDTAIKMAIRQLKTEVQQEQAIDLKLEDAPAIEAEERSSVNPESNTDDADIVLQWGAQGEPGAGLIAETILQRIEDCGVYVADLTFVTTVRTADKRRKLLPNANVLIETGAAARTGRRWGRMILVLNNAFGSVDKLPFDLKHRHLTVQYDLKNIDDPEKGDKRKRLAKDIADQVRPIYRLALTVATEQRQRLRNEQAMVHLARAQKIRADFEEQVRSDQFHHFRAQAAIMALSIIPATQPQEPVEYTKSRQMVFYKYLQPFGVSSGSQCQTVLKGTISPTPMDVKPEAMTELREDGSMLAVRNLNYGRDKIFCMMNNEIDLTKPWLLYMDVYQLHLIEHIRLYLTGMRELGIAGPWFLGLSLLKMTNGLLSPSRQWHWLHEGASSKPYSGEDMKADTLLIPADADISNDEEVEKLVKRAIKQIWKHCSFSSYPRFRGNSFSWEE